ncbi:MAG: response regulator [Candidatus Woesearchaeota archaeon]
MAAKKGDRILHVDDDIDTLKSVKKLLENEGFNVTSVLSGKKALEKLKKNKYDLILLDMIMPDMSGWDLFNKIKKSSKGAKVAFLTVVEASPQKKKAMKKEGILDYIQKPFDNKNLINRAKKLTASGMVKKGLIKPKKAKHEKKGKVKC